MNDETEPTGSARRRPAEVPRLPICTQRSAQELTDHAEAKRLRQLAIDEVAMLLRADHVPAWRLLFPPHQGVGFSVPRTISTIEDAYAALATELVDRHLVQDARWRAKAAMEQLTALYIAMQRRFDPGQSPMELG